MLLFSAYIHVMCAEERKQQTSLEWTTVEIEIFLFSPVWITCPGLKGNTI